MVVAALVAVRAGTVGTAIGARGVQAASKAAASA
jgi:hypothetical protein